MPSATTVAAALSFAVVSAQWFLPKTNSTAVVRQALGYLGLGLISLIVVLVCLAFSPLALPFRVLSEKTRRGILHERYTQTKADDGKFDAVVIGSGMGGLSCASTMARFGQRVLVLEQHDMAGGGTHTFVVDGKKDYQFDSGLHYTVPQSGELLQIACGTRDKPAAFELLGDADGDGCFDRVVLGDPTEKGFPIKHQQAHLEALKKMFPSKKDQAELDEFISVATSSNMRIPLWVVSKALPQWARVIFKRLFLGTFTRYAMQTGQEMTNKIISNPKLASLVNGLWMDAGCAPSRHSFVMTAAVNVGFPTEGGAYPVGGSESMATSLVKGIEAAGGKVLVRARVEEILIESGKAVGVRLEDGMEIHTPCVISACGYSNTFTRLLAEENVPAGYVQKRDDGARVLPSPLRQSDSWVMANLGVKARPSEFGIETCNIWIHPSGKYNSYDLNKGVDDYFEDPLSAPVIPMMITFPSLKARAPDPQHITVQLLAMAKSEWFDEWEEENGDHPEDGEYVTLKQKYLDRLLSAFLERYPGIEKKLELKDISTPLSVKWYLNKPGGGAIGLDVNPERFYDPTVEALLDMKTPIPGLWQTGEDTLLCGQPCAQAAGILTALRLAGLFGATRFGLSIVRLAVSDFLGL